MKTQNILFDNVGPTIQQQLSGIEQSTGRDRTISQYSIFPRRCSRPDASLRITAERRDLTLSSLPYHPFPNRTRSSIPLEREWPEKD
ncbi:hypothetical protein CDAR_106941 [Caerostris darwini]|uniref:Uncharacterized protein n=1 Tax=Caerostris darwini TaxID=1538125 RepID=A0AAV4SUZ8_9ARAC|nr:hypothetical protein CDAR_106941 [Caerostris darwini]